MKNMIKLSGKVFPAIIGTTIGFGVLLTCANSIQVNAYTENNFPIKLNGEYINIQGYNIDGNTYFKLRDISNEIGGFEVDFQHNIIQLSKDNYQYDNANIEDYTILSEDLLTTNNVNVINGEVYTTQWATTNGALRFVGGDFNQKRFISPIGDTLDFCFYRGRIYYISWMGGSDFLPAQIYSCNLDGSDNRLLVENASNDSTLYIADGYMYYDAFLFFDEDNDGWNETVISDGIYKMNINTGEKTLIVNPSEFENQEGYSRLSLVSCDKNSIYFDINWSDDDYYSINYNGKYLNKIYLDAEEKQRNRSDGIVKDGRRYYISGDKLYEQKEDDSSSVREICSVPNGSYYDNPNSNIDSKNSFITYVDDDYIYYTVYTMYKYNPNISMQYNDAVLCRIERDKNEILPDENVFPVYLNGERVEIKGYNIDGDTYFKLRDLSDVLNVFDVEFNNEIIDIYINSDEIVNINGEEINISLMKKNNIYYAPAREIYEKLGATVSYDDNIKTIDVVKDNVNLRLPIEKDEAIIYDYVYMKNHMNFITENALYIDNGIAMVPLGELIEVLGFDINISDESINIKSKEKNQEIHEKSDYEGSYAILNNSSLGFHTLMNIYDITDDGFYFEFAYERDATTYPSGYAKWIDENTAVGQGNQYVIYGSSEINYDYTFEFLDDRIFVKSINEYGTGERDFYYGANSDYNNLKRYADMLCNTFSGIYDLENKKSYSKPMYTISDMNNDGKIELIAVGIENSYVEYVEVYCSDNGYITKLENYNKDYIVRNYPANVFVSWDAL
ncbi:MAG: stalk domain-containing protein [Monoglobales bacterium]